LSLAARFGSRGGLNAGRSSPHPRSDPSDQRGRWWRGHRGGFGM